MDRRQLLTALLSLPAMTVCPRITAAAETDDAVAALTALERAAAGRLGLCALDLVAGRRLKYRGSERFALCSTFKLPLAALVLRAAARGDFGLDDVLPYGAADLVPHAPVTGPRVGEGGLPIRTLAEAAQTTSDNVAANLLMRKLGGPAAVTAILRELGDQQTRLDRWEPEMNLVPPGEIRDTTTPAAMADLVARLFDGHTLADPEATLLRGWMIATTTGQKRLRAGLPADWVAGDKTGTALAKGMANKHNDVAVVWRDERPILVIAAYYEADGAYDRMRSEDDAVLAAAARSVARWFAAR